MAVLQYDLGLAIDCIRHQVYLKTLADSRVAQHEKYALITYQVFEDNRFNSELFLSQASALVHDKHAQAMELRLDCDELLSKQLTLAEGKRFAF